MRTILVLCVLAVAVLATDYQSQWESFKQIHHKKYASPMEEARRFAIFRNHVDFIAKHNAEFAEGKHTYTTAINEYCDLSTEEFVAQVNGYRANANRVRRTSDIAFTGSLPTTVDWRTKGVVTPIKNQGQCGSCWSFSATGSTEGQHALTTGTLVSLSEQNLVDCSTAEGNEGCQGGLMDQAFEYIIKNNGIDTEASYPYTATGPNKCKFNRANVGATLVSYHDIPTKSEDDLQVAVATVGPVSVAIDASHQSFQVYSSGVYYEPACSQTQLDHGVLAVGYGVDNGKAYWLVKNSWGTTWGMAGYIEMSRNRSNNCGIATDASYPIAPSGNSSTSSTAATTAAAATSAGPSSGPYAAASNSAGSSGTSYTSGGSSGSSGGSSGSSGGSSGSSGGSSGSSGSYSSGGSSGSSGSYSSGGSSGSSGGSSGTSGIYFSSSGGSSGSSGSSGYSSGSSGSSGYSSGSSGSSGYSSGSSGSSGYSSGGSSGSSGSYSSGGSSGSSGGYSSGGSSGSGNTSGGSSGSGNSDTSAAGYSSGFTGFPHSSATGQSTQ